MSNPPLVTVFSWERSFWTSPFIADAVALLEGPATQMLKSRSLHILAARIFGNIRVVVLTLHNLVGNHALLPQTSCIPITKRTNTDPTATSTLCFCIRRRECPRHHGTRSPTKCPCKRESMQLSRCSGSILPGYLAFRNS